MFLDWIKRISKLNNPLRPPGAIEEENFVSNCIRCRKCVEVCPYQSIKILHGSHKIKMGTPVIISREDPCYLCDNYPCINACPSDALAEITKIQDVNMGIAKIDKDTCFAYNGILCRTCFERCPIYREGIIMEDELFPSVQKDHCVGCGICENVCPTENGSIFIESNHRVIA